TYTPTLTLNTIILPTGYAWCTGSNTPLDEPLNAGNNQQFPAIYTHPSGNYEPAEGNITVNVAKATPTYTTPTNLSATYGDLLSSVTLPNGWVWETGNVSVGAAGPQTHKATFTPSDPNNYNIVTNIDVTITVAKAPLTITANNQTIAYGDPIPTTFTATYEGFVNNEDETILNGTLTFETNYTQGNAIGTYEITLIQDIEHSRNVNYEITLTNGTLTVEKKQDTPGYDIVITNPDPNKEPIAVFEKDNNISNENKAIFTAGKNHCGIDKAQFQITIPDPSTELKVDGAAQAGTKDANGLTRHNINRELGKRGALDTLIYSLHKDDQELRADTAIIVTPIPFERIVRQKWDLLIINNNPQTNGGYYFTEFEWFKDGEKTDNTLQYYQFDQGAVFNAQMNTIEGIKINTCESNLIESEKETPPSVQKRLLGIGSATLPPNAKIYTPKGERSTGKTPGVYIVKE
ncbi:MAG: hypothetical protein LBU89_01955, partial [Fibromonadaceae bacterium]|nr:hypothetical protein [Fibromonadaceae bacterium]